MLIKAKFENSDKIYEINITDNKELTINQQLKNFLDQINYDLPDIRIFFAIYNPESHMYMILFDELQSCKN